MRAGGHPIRIFNALRDTQLHYFECSTVNGTGANTLIKGGSGITLGTFTAGVAAVTFPRSYTQFMLLDGQEDARGILSTEHQFDLRSVNLALGTAVMVANVKSTGVESNPLTGTLRFLFLGGE